MTQTAGAQTAPASPVAGAPAGSAPAASIPPKIPTAAFAAIPSMSGFKLSPDGKRVLVRGEVDGRPRLAVVDLMGKAEPIVMSVPLKHELSSYRWAGDGRVLISLARTIPWGEDEAQATRLLSYDLTTRKDTFIGRKSQGLEGDDILYVDPEGGWILLSIQKTIYDYPSVFRFDLATGEGQEVTPQREGIYEWYADNKGVVRMGVGFYGQNYHVVYRRTAEEKFRLIARPKLSDEGALFDMVRIYQDSDEGYVLSNEETGRYALYKFNLATRERGEKVFDHPVNDIEDFDTTPDGKQLLYATYTDDRARIHYFDETYAKLQAEVDAALKGRENWMTSRSRDLGMILVWTGASNDPGRYYLFQPNASIMSRFVISQPGLKPAELATSSAITYTARDGTEIHGVLTLPKGRTAKGLPLVILPHGGPFGVRDVLGFDTEVQFLANRGYAVLQPNFRGSGGYGKAFSDKGFGQWGRAMQDDLDDGMDWLAKAGTIDPKRVCIVGSSYGGYAALWGAIRNPERYRCAASFAGVSDLRKQLGYQLDFFISRKYQKNWRDKVRGAADFDLASVSPVQQAARLQVPVLIAHGEEDTTVPFKQSKWMVDALTRAGKPFEFHAYPGEGHGFDKSENLADWLNRLEAFLTRYNPVAP